jgi:hypothetical protein
MRNGCRYGVIKASEKNAVTPGGAHIRKGSLPAAADRAPSATWAVPAVAAQAPAGQGNKRSLARLTASRAKTPAGVYAALVCQDHACADRATDADRRQGLFAVRRALLPSP